MDNLKELCKEIKDFPSYCVLKYRQYDEGIEKYSELCRLTNVIADLSSYKMARVLDDTIKEIAYALPESNYETRKRYLSEAIKDLASGMNQVDVVLKYDDILYRYNGGKL